MSFADQIRNNSDEVQELRLAEDPSAYGVPMGEIIEALKVNTNIDYIRLDRDFLPGFTDQELKSQFFQAIGNLPSLKEAHISHASIPVKVLAEFVQHARHLDYLGFGCLDLEGSEGEFQMVADAMREHPTLRVFVMSDFSLNDDTVSIDGFIEALATIPNLEIVKLEVTHTRRSSLVGSVAAAKKVKVTVSGGALAKLTSSPSMRELAMIRLRLDRSDLEAVAASIKTDTSLKALAIPHCQLDDIGCNIVAEAIGMNKTIEKLDFSCNNLTDEGCITIATALKGNTSVKMLRLWGNVKISNAGFDALADMLEHNCVLERIPLMGPVEVRNRIDAKLVQNRGRGGRAA